LSIICLDSIFNSTNPLLILYYTSTTNVLFVLQLFPRWERDVPTLGTNDSHTGNKVFPRWEYITSLGALICILWVVVYRQ